MCKWVLNNWFCMSWKEIVHKHIILLNIGKYKHDFLCMYWTGWVVCNANLRVSEYVLGRSARKNNYAKITMSTLLLEIREIGLVGGGDCYFTWLITQFIMLHIHVHLLQSWRRLQIYMYVWWLTKVAAHEINIQALGKETVFPWDCDEVPSAL